MKTKKKGLIILSVIIAAAAIIIALFSQPVRTGIGNLGVNGFTGRDLQNVDDIILLSHCIEVEGSTNSVAGVKEAVRLGADGVCVDLCFRTDGTPVMSDDYNTVDTSPAVEELFKAMNDEKYSDVRIYLNIVQLSDMSELNRLAVEYNMVSRLILIGIDSAHYGMITNDDTIIPFYITVDIDSSTASAIDSGEFKVPEELSLYGAAGIVINRTDCSDKLMQAFADYGVPVIVTDIENGSQLCSALLDNARTVFVRDIKNSSMILSGWISNMQERYESSVEQSLKELSTSA